MLYYTYEEGVVPMHVRDIESQLSSRTLSYCMHAEVHGMRLGPSLHFFGTRKPTYEPRVAGKCRDLKGIGVCVCSALR